jgi:hypothetical protein
MNKSEREVLEKKIADEALKNPEFHKKVLEMSERKKAEQNKKDNNKKK